MAAKGANREFYPSKGGGKGKFKGKKGKGNPRFCQRRPPLLSLLDPVQQPGQPGYTGCFICGSQQHDFRHCPKRGKGKGGKSSGSYFVESHLGIFMLREEQIELEEECEGEAHGEIRFDPDLNGMTESEIILDPAQVWGSRR